MSIANEKYISLTTFRRNGTAVATPVWITPIGDGRAGFWTSSGSGKAKRLAHTSKVLIAPSDSRGRLADGVEPVETTATIVSSGADFDAVKRGIESKYGFQTKITKLLGTIGGIIKRNRIPYGDRVVIINLPS